MSDLLSLLTLDVFVYYFHFITVVKLCVVLNCRSKHADQVGFFKFPSSVEVAAKWIELLQAGLPANLNSLIGKKVCGRHFPVTSIYGGKYKKLMIGAMPNKINRPEREEIQSVTPAQTILRLQSRISLLERKLREITNNPKPSFIFTHRKKLKSYMNDDAYTLFDSCLTNHNRAPSGRRHSYETKKLTNMILHRSKKAYSIMKEIFALPSLRTMDRHNHDIFTETGISHDTKSLLKRHAANLASTDRLCILSFDEVEIHASYAYLHRRDIVDGFVDMGIHGRAPHEATQALVFGQRGIQQRWKQIISYYFVTKQNFRAEKLKEIVEENLQAMFEAGYNVVATVCDGDSKNRALYDSLGTDPSNSQFTYNGHQISFLFDIPHIFKLIRNHFMKSAIYIEIDSENRGIIVWEDILPHLESIVNSPSIPKICKNLTMKHLHPNTYEKMRVSLATQLFSHTVGSAIEFAVVSNSLSERHLLTAKFFKLMDKLFDVLNSSTTRLQNGKPWKTALAMNDENFIFLQYIEKLLCDDKFYFCKSNHSILTPPEKVNNVHCLKMLLKTIRGILSLSLRAFDLGIERIFTRRLDQDILENFFAQIRRSSSDLSTRHFRAHFRSCRIVFLEALPDGSNCEDDEDIPLFLEDVTESSASSMSTEVSPEAEIAEYLAAFNQELLDELESLDDSTPSPVGSGSNLISTFLDDDIGQEHSALHQFSPMPSFGGVTVAERNVHAYVAGYLLNRIEKSGINCTICWSKLTANKVLADHDLIVCRQYAPSSKLHFPSESFTNLVTQCCLSLNEEVKNAVAVTGVKLTLLKIIWKMDFFFIPICHQSVIKSLIIKLLVNMFLGKYLKDLGRESKHKSIKSIQKNTRPS